MSSFDMWLTIVLMTLATIITRSSFFLLGDRVKLPGKVQHALRYAPAAAMAAIIAPDLFVAGSAPYSTPSCWLPAARPCSSSAPVTCWAPSPSAWSCSLYCGLRFNKLLQPENGVLAGPGAVK